ncbi:MAG: amidohydrolase family protein [Microbacteriaceae bacterium]
MSALLLRGARLASGAEPVDLLLRDGRIAAIAPRIDEAVEAVDLEGRHVVPGLWDAHVHANQWALALRRFEVGAAESAAEAAAIAARHLPRAEPGQTLVGYGFRDGLWPDAPSRELLDAATGAHPVVLVSGDLHAAWANSAACARYGVVAPTGLVREERAFALVRELDAVDDAVLDRWVGEAALVAAARGVVGVVDMEMRWSRDAWLRRIAGGQRSLRVEAAVYPQDIARATALRLPSGALVDGGEGLLAVGAAKIITDGSLNTRTAFCADPYAGLDADPHGLLTVPHEELVEHLRLAERAGLRPAVHAIGDRANTLALDAFAAAGIRGSIEHAQLLAAEDVPRFAELGVVASVQPEHAMDDRDVAEHYWAGRTERAFPLRALLDTGATLALGSDAPVAPLDPWVAMDAAVTRSRDGRGAWHGEQSITRAEALGASVRSSVAVGEPADLAVLDADPGAHPLRTMPVAATLLEGRFTHHSL